MVEDRDLAFLGLGSNLGDRRANLEQALWSLHHADPDLRVGRVSSVYESEPVGPVRDQPLFYNAVAQVQTTLDPCALLKRCLEVEALMGRRRQVVKGPRVIDIDLLLIGDLVASWPQLTIPHPELSHRAFVLLPLLEISPMLTDPRDDTLLCRLIDSLLRSQSIVKAGPLGSPAVSG